MHRTSGWSDHRIIGPSGHGSSDHATNNDLLYHRSGPSDHRTIGSSRTISDRRTIGSADHRTSGPYIIWSSDHQMHIWWSSDQDLYGPLKWSDIYGRVDVWSGDGCVFFRFPVLQLFTLPSCQASKLHSMIISSSASFILGLCKLCSCVRALCDMGSLCQASPQKFCISRYQILSRWVTGIATQKNQVDIDQ